MEPNMYLISFCRQEVPFGITWLTATSTWTCFRRRKTDTILNKQLGEVFDQQVNHTVKRKVHKSYLIERFNMEQSWIETFIVPFKLSLELQYSSEKVELKTEFTVTMRVRDVQGGSYVHHNLEECDRNNKFFMYLVHNVATHKFKFGARKPTKNDSSDRRVFQIFATTENTPIKFHPIGV